MNMFYSLKHIRGLRNGLIPRLVLVSMKRNILNIINQELDPGTIISGFVYE